MGNPTDAGSETLFGLPVYQTSHATSGTGLVGAFRAHSQFFVRQGMELAVSNQNEDYFTKLKVAVRAYMRGQLVVYRASAFCEITGI
jgi:HK97 family phage major capsid protein